MKKKNKMKVILVTGGAGYIGSHLVNKISQNKKKIVVIDNLSNGRKSFLTKKSIFFKIDLLDIKKLEKIFKNYHIEGVFHFAALTTPDEAEKSPNIYYTNNVLGTDNLIKMCIKYKIKKFIFSSTCAVYGNSKIRKVNEKNKTEPFNIYGQTKLLSELSIKNSFEKTNYKYAILRYFNVIGSCNSFRRGPYKTGPLFNNIAKNISNKKYEIEVFGKDYNTKDGTCYRDYIDVNDLVNMHIHIYNQLDSIKNLIINCGYNKSYSILEIIKLFENVIGRKLKIKIRKKRPGDIEKIYSDCSLFYSLFPKFKKEFTVSQSIKNMLKWYNIAKN